MMRSFVSIFGFLALSLLLVAQQPEKDSSTGSFTPVEKTIYYRLGETEIPLRIFQYGANTSNFYVNLHDNESTSVEAAQQILPSTGGKLLKIVNGSERLIRFRYHGATYVIDPNRVFSREGIRASLEENSRADEGAVAEVEKFAVRILEEIPGSAEYIIALHNNTPNGFSIDSYMKGGEYHRDADKVHRNRNEDPDDLILTTDKNLYKKISRLGYNAILQDNDHATRDGSLSIWSGENKRRYINIETEHGKLGKYVEMLQKVVRTVNSEQ
jgi:hypothetical protein